MRWLLPLFVLLVGCDSPAPPLSGAEVTRIEADGYRFSLRRQSDVVEVIRTGFVRRPDIAQIGLAAELAVEKTYGCTVTQMRGDVALMAAKLDCARRPDPKHRATWVRPRKSGLACLAAISCG